MSTTTKQLLTTALLRGYFQPLARKGPLGKKLVFMFMDHKGPLCSYSQGWVATPKRQRENVLINHPERSSWLTIQSVSSIDIPCPIDRFNLKLDCQKEGDLRWPQAGFRVRSSVTGAREARFRRVWIHVVMTLFGIIHHDMYALYWRVTFWLRSFSACLRARAHG